jgi:hypothetical protein
MTNTKLTLAVALFGFGIAGCSNPVNITQPVPRTTPAASFTQIELLSRPAVKEVFEPYQDHQITNAIEPYNDPTIKGAIIATEDALRPATATTDYGKALAGVLYPNEYLVNLNGAAPASGTFFLSTEVSGGADFGGRAPNDDVIDLELGALFGNTLPALGLIADDHQENNCLSSQNIGTEDPAKKTTATFPYLAAAR